MYKLWNTLTIGILIIGLAVSNNVAAQIYIFTSLDVPDSTSTEAMDINDSGEVVGRYSDIDNIQGTYHGFKYNAGTYMPYPDVGSVSTQARGNNNSGEIAGNTYGYTLPLLRGFHDNGTTVPVPIIHVPGSVWNSASGINNMGQIVGHFSMIGGTTSKTGYIYDVINLSFTFFTKPGAETVRTEGYGINDSGMVVGASNETGSNVGFIYDGTSFTELTVPGAIDTIAFNIDSTGYVVGRYKDSLGFAHGYLYDGIGFTTIDVNFPDAQNTRVRAINNFGQIVGDWDSGGRRFGFVATPIAFIGDGDIAPLGSPDGVVNAADCLIAQRIVLGDLSATGLELAHGDLYPPGLPDGVINTSDLLLIQQLAQ